LRRFARDREATHRRSTRTHRTEAWSMNNVEHLIHASRVRALDPAWDGARSRRVFEGALRSRAARGRRQRLVAFACAASAALFLLGVRTSHLQAPLQTSAYDNGASSQLATGSDSLGASTTSLSTGGAISMNSDLFADGGREAD
jgi:hypothetical protein